MKGIAQWLASIGLERYTQRFVENAIDDDVLVELTEGDLKKLGIPLGDRKRLIKAIRAMLADSPSALTTTGVGEDAQSGELPVATAERRHLTVMICDLVGSTALSTRLDPEDMRAVIDAYHAACARITRTYDGFLAEFRGVRLELRNCGNDIESRSYGSLGIVFVREGITEISQYPVASELGEEAVIGSRDTGASGVIGVDHDAHVLRIESGRQGGRAH